MSAISPQRAERAIRERFNPIKGLRPDRLSRILDQYHAGYLREAALLWDAMERRDLLLRTVAAKRKKSVARAQYEILAIDKSDGALLHKKVLEKFYDNLVVTDVLKQDQRGGAGLLRRQMMDAVGKGYAVHEITWMPVEGDGAQRAMGKRMRSSSARASAAAIARAAATSANANPENESAGPDFSGVQFMTAQLSFCPLWFFENRTGRLRFLESDGDTDGVEMKSGEWLVTIGDAIMEPCSVAYCYKHMGLKDWVSYSQAFGSPIPWGKTGAARDSDEWKELESAVSRMMSEMSIVTSDGENIELIEAKGGGSNFPMPNLVEYCDRGMAAAWRGNDLSTISRATDGTGASLQGDEGDLLQEDDANDITEQLWQVDRMVVKMVTGDEEPLAYIKILPPKKQAVAQDIQIDTFLAGMGCELSQDDAMERYGRSPAQEGDPLLMPVLAGQATNPEGNGPRLPGEGSSPDGAQKNLANAVSPAERARVLKAKRDLMGPVFKELRRIEALPDGPQQQDALRGLLAEMPALRERLQNEAASGEVADELMQLMEAALEKGFVEGKKITTEAQRTQRGTK